MHSRSVLSNQSQKQASLLETNVKQQPLNDNHSQASLQSKLERAIANACNADRGDLQMKSTYIQLHLIEIINLKSMLKTFVSMRPNWRDERVEKKTLFVIRMDDSGDEQFKMLMMM